MGGLLGGAPSNSICVGKDGVEVGPQGSHKAGRQLISQQALKLG